MLKLRTPVKLSLRNDLFRSKEEFVERIRGNYAYMGSDINETDLLHLTTQPPEVYLMGGGMGNVVNSSNTENTQIQKVNIINNLINRILISADAKLSYQDRIYISNVLHQLGIKDERKFMNEVKRLTKQTKELNDVTNLYWNNVEELREMVSQYAGDMRLEFKSENEVINSSILHLHEVVNRRLKTAAVYQIMRNFYEHDEGDKSITNEEFRISEQGRFAKEVLLNRLRETVRLETQALVYRHENIYEGDETNVDNINVSQLNERINSAVLMNLIDNIYELSYERIDHHVRNWLSLEDSFYGASDNVLYRFEQNTAYLQYLHEEFVKNIDHTDNYENEIKTVKQLIDIGINIEKRLMQDGDVSYSGDNFSTQNVNISDVDNTRFGDSFVSADMEYAHYENINEQYDAGNVIRHDGDVYNTQISNVNVNNNNISGYPVNTSDGKISAEESRERADAPSIINSPQGDKQEHFHTINSNEYENETLFIDSSVSVHQPKKDIADGSFTRREEAANSPDVAPVDLTFISNRSDNGTKLNENINIINNEMREIQNIIDSSDNRAFGVQDNSTVHVSRIQTGAVETVNVSSSAQINNEIVNTQILDTYNVLNEGASIDKHISLNENERVNTNNISLTKILSSEGQSVVAPEIPQAELTHISTNIDIRENVADNRSFTDRAGDTRISNEQNVQNAGNTYISQHDSHTRLTVAEESEKGENKVVIREGEDSRTTNVNITVSGDDIVEGDTRLYESNRSETDNSVNISSLIKDVHITEPSEGRTAAELTYVTKEGDLKTENKLTEENRQINESLYQTYQQNFARNKRYMQELKKILENNAPEKDELSPAQKTMQAAAMALEHPEHVIERFVQSETHERERLENIRRESEKLLHPLQQRAHRLIREYLQAPERFYMSEQISQDNIGILLHDIYHTNEKTRQGGAEADADMYDEGSGSSYSETALAGSLTAASDRGAVVSSYPDTGSNAPRIPDQRAYEALTLHNIYPVYNIKADDKDISITIDNIASTVRERALAIKEAAEKSAGTKEVLEHILREESSSVREFSNVIMQQEVMQGREAAVRREKETVNRLLESVVNRWAKRAIENTEPVTSYEDEKLSFIHKSTENSVDEETIENIRSEMLRMEQTQRSLSEHTQNLIREEKTVVNNVNSRTIEENSEEIQRVVNRSVRSQIDAITEKVYGRIERQLKNEQRRRGL